MLPASTICEARSRVDGVLIFACESLRVDDHRRVLEDAGPCPLRQRRKPMDIFAAVDLERPRVIDAVEIMGRLEHAADAVDLPTLDLGFEILAERQQPADQGFAGVDLGYLQRAFAPPDARDQILGRGGAHIVSARPGQRPKLARIVQPDALRPGRCQCFEKSQS